MALGRNEIFIMIRAQDMASSQLRRVASDLNKLGRMEGMRTAQTQLAINRGKLLNKELGIRNRLEQMTTGTRAIRNESRRNQILREREDLHRRLQRQQEKLNAVPTARRDIGLRKQAANARLATAMANAEARGVQKQLAELNRLRAGQLASAETRKQLTANTQALTNASNAHTIATKAQAIAQQRFNAVSKDGSLRHQVAAKNLAAASERVRRLEQDFGNLAAKEEALRAQEARNLQMLRRHRAGMGDLRSKHADLARSADVHARSMSSLNRAEQASIREEQRLGDALNTTRGRLRENSAQMRATNAASREMGRGIQRATNDLAIARQELAKNTMQHQALREGIRQYRWDSVARGGRVLRDTGRATRLFGFAAVAGLGMASSAYADFSTQATLAATQTGKTTGAVTDQISEVGKNSDVIMEGILKQMRQFPASAEEMSAAAYEIYSSTNLGSDGIRGVNNGLKLLTTLNKAAVAGQVDLSDVTAAMTSVMNSYGSTVEDMPKILGRMFAAVRFGRMSFADFIGVFSQIIPAARAADQSLDTTMGTFAALTRLVPNVRMAGAGFARMLEIFGRKDFIEGAKQFGIEMTNARGEMLQLPDLLKNMHTWLMKLPLKERAGALRNFFKIITAGTDKKGGTMGTIQARRAFQQLMKAIGATGKIMVDHQDIVKQVTHDNKEFAKSFSALSVTPGVKFKTFTNSLRALIMRIGKEAMPLFVEIGKHIEDLLNWWDKLDKETKDQITRWVGYAAVLSLVGGSVAALAGGIIGLIAVLGRMRLLTFGLGGTIMGVVLALQLLHGQWHTAGDAANGFGKMATSSLEGFTVAAGLAVAASLKVSRAYTNYSNKRAASAKVVARASRFEQGTNAGLMASTFGSGGGAERRGIRESFRAASAVEKNAKTIVRAGGLARGALSAAGTAAVALPGPLKLAAVAIGGVGLAAWLLSRRADAAAKRVADLKRAIYGYQAALRSANQVGQLGTRVQDFQQATDQVKRLRIELKLAQKDLKGLKPGATRQLKILDIRQLKRDLADAQSAVGASFAKIMRSVQNVNEFRKNQRNLFGDVVRYRNQIERNQTRINELQKLLGDNVNRGDNNIRRELDNLKTSQAQLRAGMTLASVSAAQAAQTFASGLGRSIDRLSKIGLIPKKISADLKAALALFVAQTGRLDLPTIKQFIKLYNDPQALANANGEIANFIRANERKQIKIRVRADVKKVSRDDLLKLGRGPLSKQGALEVAGKVKIKSVQKPNLAQISKLMGTPSIFTKAVKPANAGKVKKDVAAFFKKPIKQPIDLGPVTPKAAVLGASIVNGIAAGVNANSGSLNTAVVTAVNNAVAAGKNAAKAKSPSQVTMREIGAPMAMGIAAGLMTDTTASTAMVYSIRRMVDAGTHYAQISSPSKLTKRKIGDPLIAGIVQGIVEGLPAISDAATLTIDAFNGPWLTSDKFQTMLEGKAKATKREIARMKLDIEDAKNRVSKYAKEVDKAKKGSDKWKDSTHDLRTAQLDLKDAQAELAGSGGKAKRRETVGDLQKDLSMQLANYRQFNNSLKALQRKNVPKGLLDQLKALGVDGVKHIKLLNTMSASQLRKYIKTWRAANAEIKRSAQAGLKAAAKAAMIDFVTQAKEELSSRKSEIRDTFIGWWDGLFNAALSQAKDTVNGGTGDVASVYMELFAGPWLSDARNQAKKEWGIPFSKEDLMKDLQQQVDVVKKWKGNLNSIFARLGPAGSDFVAYLRSLGPDAAAEIATLSTMTDTELIKYVGLWRDLKVEGQAAASDAINNVLTPEMVLTAIESANTQFKAFRAGLVALAARKYTPQEIAAMFPGVDQIFISTLGRTLSKVPADLVDYIKGLGPEEGGALLDAILKMTPEQLATYVADWKQRGLLIGKATTADFGLVLDDWKKQGNNIALALIAGVTEKQGELLKFFRNLFANMLATARKETKSSSPSRVYMGLAHDMVDGMTLGLRKADGLTMPTPGMGDMTKPMVGGAYANQPVSNTHNTFNMNVTAQESESLETTLERASFRLRNRNV